MVRRLAQRRLILPIAAFALSLLSCGREVTGPENGIFRNRIAMLAFEPVFTGPIAAIEGAGDAVPFEKVRVVLRDADGAIVKDTMVDFPSDADEISLSLTIPIPQDAPLTGLPLTVSMAYVNAVGDTVFRGGPNPLTARPVGSPGASTPVTVPVTYDGPGKNAARVAITPKTGTAVAGETRAFSATAFDADDAPIANTPFVFSSLDPTRATIDPVTGVATWLPVRGTARIVADLPNGNRADTATFTVALPAAKLVLGSGGAQTGAVNAALGDSIVVRTLASDDVPVEGVIVTFAVATGEGTLGVLTDTSDANGDVKTAWTLGATLGAQTITATSAGLTGSPLTIGATAVAAAPVRLEITQEPGAGIAGTTLAPALTVIARDAFGNVATSFTDEVTVSVVGAEPPALDGTPARAAVGGTVNFDDLGLTKAGEFRLVVTSGSLEPDTTAALLIEPAAASQLVMASQPPTNVTAGANFAASIEVQDAFGNRVDTWTTPVTVGFDLAPVGASFLSGGSADVVSGEAEFTDLQLDRAGLYRLRFTSDALTAALSDDFTVNAAGAEAMNAAAGDLQTAVAGTALPTPLAVVISDNFGNPISGVTVTWSVVSGGGSFNVPSSVTDAAGQATAVWTLGTGAGEQQASATAGFLPAVEFTATATAGAAAQLVLTAAPTNGVAGTALAPLTAVVQDALGNPVLGYSGSVTVTLSTNPSAASLGGTVTRPTVAGVVTFDDLVLVQSGIGFALRATLVNESIQSDTTASFTVAAAPATQLVVTQQPPTSTPAGQAFSVTVEARDQFGNVDLAYADSATIIILNGSVGATLGGVTKRVMLGGSVTFSGLTLDRTGNYELAISAPGLPTAVTTSSEILTGAAAFIAQATVSNDGQTGAAGDTLAPFRVRVTDIAGNPVSGVNVTWTPTGGGSFVDAVTVTDANGEAEGRLVAPQDPGPASAIAEASGLSGSPVGFSATIEVGPAARLAILVAPTPLETAGIALTDFVVRAENRFGYPAAFADTMRVVVVDGPVGGGIIAGDTAVLADSSATFSGITFDRTGDYTLEFRAAGLDSVRYVTISVSAGAASSVVLVSGDGQSGTVTTTLAAPLVVELRDALGNVVPDRDVQWAVTSGDANVTIGTVQTDASGRSQTEIVLGDSAGAVTVTATFGALPPVEFTATALGGVATAVVELVAPAGSTAGVAIGSFSYGLQDQFGNPATGFSGTAVVTLEPADAGQPEPVILGGDSVVVVDGVATWNALVIASAGQYRIVADFGGGIPAFTSGIITIDPAGPAQLLLDDGDGQSAVVLQSTANPLRARVTDSFGNPVSGVNVNFNLVSGVNATLGAATVPTDADGYAEVTVEMDTVAGALVVGAFAAGLTPDSLLFNLTALPDEPNAVLIDAGDGQTLAAGGTSDTVRVLVHDAYGNPVPGQTVTWETESDLTFDAPSSVSDSSGYATVTFEVGGTLGLLDFYARYSPEISAYFTVTVEAGAATSLVFLGDPASLIAGSTLDTVTVELQDAFGNRANTAAATVALAADPSLTAGSIGGTLSVAADSGLAKFGDLVLTVAGPYRFVVTASGLAADTTAQFDVFASDPDTVFISGGDGQTGVVGTALTEPLAITVRDAFGNPIVGYSTGWSIVGEVGALLDSTFFTTDSSGVARATLVFGTSVESFDVLASAGDAGSVTFSVAAANAPASRLVMDAEPTTVTAGDTIGPVAVLAEDAFLNFALDFAGEVSVSLDTAPELATLGGTTTVTAVDGIATFSDITLDKAGLYRLRFSSAGLEDVVTEPFYVTAAAVAAISIVDGDAQTDTVGATLAAPLRVRVTDAYGNPVAGESLDVSADAGVSLGELPIGTDGFGEMTIAATLGTAAGSFTVTVAIAALPDSSVTFTLTALAGTATELVVTTAPDSVVAGEIQTIVVEAQDQHGNTATSFTGDVNIVRSDAIADPQGTVTVTAVDGVATFSNIYFAQAGSYYLNAESDALSSSGFEVVATAAAATSLSIVSGDGQASFTGFALDAPVVLRIADAYDNPVIGDTIVVAVASGGGTVGDLVDTVRYETDGSGQVSVVWTLGLDVGTQTLEATFGALGPITISATATQSVANAIWTGDASTDPADPSNWRNGLVPAASDSVLIPGGRANYPAMLADTTYAKLTIEDGATFDVGNSVLTVAGDLRAPLGSGIGASGEGSVRLAATDGTVSGTMPAVTVEGSVTTSGTLLIAGALSVVNSGSLTVATGDSLHVETSVYTDAGGSLTQQTGSAIAVLDGLYLNGGVSQFAADASLHLYGNLETGGDGDPRAFVADSAHALYLRGSSVQAIEFSYADTTPGGACEASCLGTVYGEETSGGISFQTNAMAQGGFRIGLIANVAEVNGGNSFVVAGAPSTLRGNAGTAFRRFAFTTGFPDVVTFSTDTLVALGTGVLSQYIAFPTIVAGSYRIVGIHSSDLIVEGTLDVDGPEASVNGALQTRGSGYLQMTDATDSLVVFGEIRFEGTASSGQLTAGVLEAISDVYVGGTSAVFADSGHVLRFANSSSLTVTDSTNARFGSMRIVDNAGVGFTGRVLRLAGDVTILDQESQLYALDSARVEIGGRLTDSFGSGMSFTTTVLSGTDAIATPRMYGTVALRGPTSLSDTLRVFGTLAVESGGALVLNGQRIEVDSLFTSGTGSITMSNAADTVTVFGTALFNGGSSVLTEGRLRVAGRVDGSGAAFQGEPTHTTEFFGEASQQVGFGNPGFGAGQAHFGRIELNKSGGAPFSSTAVYANGQLVTVAPSQTWQGIVAANTLNIRGADVSYLALPNQPLVLADGADVTMLDSLHFSSFSESGVTQLSVQRAGSGVTVSNAVFDTIATSPVYLSASDANTSDNDTLKVTMVNPRPTSHGGRIATAGGALILDWGTFEAIIWTGALNGDWFNASNWAQNVVPAAQDSVVVPDGLSLYPTLSNPATVRALNWQYGDPFSVTDTLTILRSYVGGGETDAVACSGNGAMRFAPADSARFVGYVSCPVVVTQGTLLLANQPRTGALTVDGTGRVETRIFPSSDLRIFGGVLVRGNGSARFGHETANVTVQINGDLTTADNGVIEMRDLNTLVTVAGDATFDGGSTDGLLIAGTIRYSGNFQQGASTSGSSHLASGSHFSEFVLNDAPRTITFATPGWAGSQSRLSHFYLIDGSGSELLLGSDVYHGGQLLHGISATATLGTTGGYRTLYGAGAAADYVTFDGVRWELGSVVAVDTMTSLSFVNQDPDAVQFLIARNGTLDDIVLQNLNFSTQPTAGVGRYLRVEDIATDENPLVVTVQGVFPSYRGSNVEVIGEAVLNGWEESGPALWTGAINGAFDNPNNWATGVVAQPGDSITVSSSASTALEFAGQFTVGALVVESGGQVLIGDTLTVQRTLRMPGGTSSCYGNAYILLDNQTADTLLLSIRNGGDACNVDIVAGAYALADSLVTTNVLRVTGFGHLEINGQILETNSNFGTVDQGTFAMRSPADTVRVIGQVILGGGSTASMLTDGVMLARADFLQGGDALAFFASDNHRVILGDSVTPLGYSPGINFNDPQTSTFANVEIANGTWTNTNAFRATTLRLRNGAAFDGAAVRVDSSFVLDDGTSLAVRRFGITGNLIDYSGFSADTVDFLGKLPSQTGQVIPPLAAPYKHIRVFGTAWIVDQETTVTVDSSITVLGDGQLIVGDMLYQTFNVGLDASTATLVTQDNGRFGMGTTGTVVVDSAHFDGPAANGIATRGTLEVRRALVQRATTSPSVFQGDTLLTVYIPDSASIDFASVDSSMIGNLSLAAGSVLTLRSDLLLRGTLSRAGSQIVESDVLLTAAPRVLRVEGGVQFFGSGDSTTFRNVSLKPVADFASGGGSFNLSGMRFEQMEPTSTFLDATELFHYTIIPDNVSFASAVSGGKYFEIPDSTTLAFQNAFPAVGCLSTTTPGCVGPRYEPGFPTELNEWQGLSNDWHDPDNWSLNHVPLPYENVLIVSGLDYSPVLNADAEVLDLTVQPGASLSVGYTLTIRGNASFSESTNNLEGGFIILSPDSASVTLSQAGTSGNFDLPIAIVEGVAANPTVRLTSDFVIGSSFSDVTVVYGTLDLNGHRLEISASDFVTEESGRLAMSAPTDSLHAVNFVFSGGSTAGLLTDGAIYFTGSFTQDLGAPDAFAAVGSHRTIAGGPQGADSVVFANPGFTAGSSHFASFRVDTSSFGDWARFRSSAVVLRDLTVADQAQLSLFDGDTLDVIGNVYVAGQVRGNDNTSALRMRTGNGGASLGAPGSIAVPLVLENGVDLTEGRVTLNDSVNLDTIAGVASSALYGLYQRSGILDLNGNTLRTLGGFRVGGTGILEMDAPTDSVYALQDVVFAGGNSEGYLTDGKFVAVSSGFFQIDSTSDRSFVSTGNHQVIIAGPLGKLDMNFASSSPTTSRIANLAIQKDAAAVVFVDAPWASNDTVYVGNLTALESDVEVDLGSIVVTGSVPIEPPSTITMMQSLGVFRLDGLSDPATCDGNIFAVSGFRGQFIPSACHTPPLVVQNQSYLEPTDLNAITVRSTAEVIAVGAGGLILGADYSSGPESADWQEITSPTGNDLLAIDWVDNDGTPNYYAVGTGGTILQRIGEGEFEEMSSLVSVTLRGVRAISWDNVIAVGDSGTILHYDGSEWSVLESGTEEDLYGIGGAEALYIVGANGTILQSMNLGGSWSQVFNGVTAVTLRAVLNGQGYGPFVVGDDGTVLDMQEDPPTFNVSPGPINGQLRAAALDYGLGLVVGDNGVALERQSLSWTAVPALAGETLNGIATVQIGQELYAIIVGSGGVIYSVRLTDAIPG